MMVFFFFFSSRRRHTRLTCDWSSDVCSSDLPFVVTVGALDLHNSTNTEQTSVPPWSAWGYTYDGFAKPELSAPGRAITGPIPSGSTLANDRKGQVVETPDGTYIKLSGT